MVRRLNEGVLDSSDDLLKAIIDACAEVYGDEWDSMNGDEQHDIIMGFIKQAAKNIKSESVKKKNSKPLEESVSDKLELQEIANAINALNDDRSWVELDASVQKRVNQSSRFKYVCCVMVTNHSYTNVTDEYRVVQAHRGGFVIHYDNPIGSEWISDAQKVIDYFEEMVALNIEEDF